MLLLQFQPNKGRLHRLPVGTIPDPESVVNAPLKGVMVAVTGTKLDGPKATPQGLDAQYFIQGLSAAETSHHITILQ